MKPINPFPVLTFFLFCFPVFLNAQNIPVDYRLLYQQSFEREEALKEIECTDSQAWKLGNGKENKALEIFKASNYSPRFRSPFNIALLKTKKLGSFVLEADLQQTGKEYGHRDLCLFFGAKDPSNFYYVHIASKADAHAHNIFLVNDAPRVAIGEKVTDGVDWGKTDSWHRVRLERDLEKGSIKVYFDDMTQPIMESTDHHFDFGYIGLGTFDDVGKFDNIKIWGKGFAPEKNGFFH
ncbi:hypothetical protein QWY93_10745 [Echinicola jeungdonensis]|uniref:Uncharacterized protein n=1 Tax=Echinicola jeungdonensis TaxID=709343 RepID=A0ABV5J6E3_9BACT|nr:hypothetical protein [Echinicola jeungdonensis]MDN3669801.1 hypothetical protein [Echinicola jeungdonensis]